MHNPTADALEQALSRKLEEDVARLTAMVAARNDQGGVEANIEFEAAFDDFMAGAAQLMSDPIFMRDALAGNIAQQAKGATSATDAARSRYLEGLSTKAQAAFMQRSILGTGADEANDYNDAWCDAFDEPTHTTSHAKRNAFANAYVNDLNLPTSMHMPVMMRYQFRSDAMSMSQSIDDSFYGRNPDMPMFQNLSGHTAQRLYWATRDM